VRICTDKATASSCGSPSSSVLWSAYVQGPTGALPPIYDLYAVSQHSGGLGGGHYTAVCKVPLSSNASILRPYLTPLSDPYLTPLSDPYLPPPSARCTLYTPTCPFVCCAPVGLRLACLWWSRRYRPVIISFSPRPPCLMCGFSSGRGGGGRGRRGVGGCVAGLQRQLGAVGVGRGRRQQRGVRAVLPPEVRCLVSCPW
jgi:hypothetical protein